MHSFFSLDPDHAFFDWDDEKDRINFLKHGIHFRTAVKVFLDPNRMIHEDEEHGKETRYDILGKVGKILFVVCAVREPDTIRLISARIATKTEQEIYEYGEDENE